VNEYNAMLRAICAEPDEDTPRLVLADLMQESGEEHLAEFIRAQVAYASETRKTYRKPIAKRITQLLRGSVLLRRYPWINKWLDDFKFGFSASGWGYSVVPIDQHVYFSRGFVSAITLPRAAFMQHARAIFSANPVTRVVLSDMEYRVLPDGLVGAFYPGPGYAMTVQQTEDECREVMSRAKVSQGRAFAGLPPLRRAEPVTARGGAGVLVNEREG
jgi:uncharacterized protein (TIGR02996 family)